jgi:hypothetical protein
MTVAGGGSLMIVSPAAGCQVKVVVMVPVQEGGPAPPEAPP